MSGQLPTSSMGLRVADFDFDLPEGLIAQQPPAERGASRMLVVNRDQVGRGFIPGNATADPSGALAPDGSEPPFTDLHFTDLPSLLNPGDLLILNDSRVIPARLFARRGNARGKQEATGQIEVLLTVPDGEGNWAALVRPGRKVRIGDRLEFPSSDGTILLEAEVISSGEFGERILRFTPVNDFFAILERIGHTPLPPYIRRVDANTDRERYQTVYAAQKGSVAAPTAGLHFTPAILSAITARGVEIAKVTLHVGLGTFAPLRVDRVEEIRLHRERYTLPPETATALNRARAESRRIVAVGTTAVRTLEHCAQIAEGPQLTPHSGETSIFISPGFQFRLVGAMLTNFHLPQSSLLMLVSAFAGRERVLAAYAHAVRERYRFFSYGDCMFLA
jgi:S-adenosylmethionine:tRNA ribosyltransferase-isomerase